MEIKLGQRVKDKISGFEGIAVCRTEWLYGCVRYGLQSDKLKEDGTLTEIQSFDEPQLELMKEQVKNKKKKKYGWRKDPVRI